MTRNQQTAALICIFLCSAGSNAATFCATDSTELQQALEDATTNNQDDVIRVANGTYFAPPGGFVFDNHITNDDQDLTISGGWSAFFGNACGQQLSGSVLNGTILDGNSVDRVLHIFPNTNTDVQVSGLVFRNGATTGMVVGCGAGLRIGSYVGYAGNVTLSRNAFLFNDSEDYGGGLCGGAGGRLEISGSYFFGNTAACTNGAASITHGGSQRAYIINNTVVYNNVGSDCLQGSPHGGFRYGGLSEALMVNNIFWGNDNADLDLDGDARLVANNYQVRLGTPAAGSGIDYSFAPAFVSVLTFNFRLADHSPLVDLGVVPASTSSWQLTDADLDDNPRVRGNSVDLGAFEKDDVVFADSFD